MSGFLCFACFSGPSMKLFSSSFLVMHFIDRFTWMVIWVVLRFGLIANKETVNGSVLIFVWTHVPFL